MKTLTKLMSLALVIALFTLLLAACSGGGASSSSSASSGGGASSSSSAQGTDSSSSEEEELDLFAGDPIDVYMLYMVASGGNATDIKLIEEALQKITLEKINVNFHMETNMVSDYATQVTLKLSSGEPLDLLVVQGNNLATYVNNESILPITDLLNSSFGAGVKEALGEYWNSGSLNGEVYAVPTIRDLCRGGGLNVRTDLLDKYNIDPTTLKSLEDMTPVFQTLKDGEGANFYPLCIAGAGTTFLDNYVLMDSLNDGFGVLLNFGLDNTDVVLFQESEPYREHVELFSEWYAAGYIQPDVATTQESYGPLMQTGNYFGYYTNCKPGIKETAQRNTGWDITTLQFLDYFATSAQVLSFNYGIAQSSEVPEAAMAFLNLMYTDTDVVTTLSFGIEDVHYQVMDDGRLGYLDGKDSATTGWSVNTSWLNGNQFMCKNWITESTDLWERQAAANEGAKPSLALGFMFNNSSVSAEVAACNNVVTEYKRQIDSGLDPSKVDEMIGKYVSALKAAGVEKIMAEKQSQLDAWLAAK